MGLRFRQLKDKTAARLFTKYPAMVEKWAQNVEIRTFSDVPWSPLATEVNQCRLALVTTGGVHLKTQPPFDMFDPSGDPTFREISDSAPFSDLAISHNYYNHRDADKDINILLPLQRVIELKQGGEIKSVNHRHFSFMGHIKDHHIDTLINKTAPDIAHAFQKDGVDIVILTPG
jgi:D-proline reductase (dithiol) PrdB